MQRSKLVRLGVFVLLGLLISAPHADERVDTLLASLQSTSSPREAREIERAIWAIWNDAGDETLNALYSQGRALVGVGRLGEARAVFSELIEKAPGFAEGWNQRATVLYFMNEYDASLADIERTLALEPRHYGAIFGKALIFTAHADYQHALETLDEMERVNPHARGIRRLRSQIKSAMEPEGV